MLLRHRVLRPVQAVQDQLAEEWEVRGAHGVQIPLALPVHQEDMPAARDTLNRVRAFIKENKTVYLSTHTPLGYENLESQKIMELPDVEETSIAETKDEPNKVGGTVWVCSVCGYEHVGDEPPAKCPRCKQPSTVFKKKV